MESAVSYAKQSSNLLAYYTFDEIISTQLDAGEDLYDIVNTEDGYHPVFAIFMPQANCNDTSIFINACDIEAVDAYVKPPVKDVNWVTKCAYIRRPKALQNNKTFWMAISAQYDADTEIKRAIRPDEQHCQTYLALIHGAKGIFYFRYPLEHQTTWDSFAGDANTMGLTAELSALAPCILTPDLKQKITYSEWNYTTSAYESVLLAPLSNSYPAVQVSLRKAPDGADYDYLLLATNTKSYSVEVDYTVSLLTNTNYVYTRVFDSSDSNSYAVSNCTFDDILEAYATRAYTFDSSSSDPITINVAVTPPQTIPTAETSYPSTGRSGMTNIFRNPTLETDSFTLSNWPNYCWPFNVDQSNRIGTASQSWGLILTTDLDDLKDAIEDDGGDAYVDNDDKNNDGVDGDGDPGTTCLKITYPGSMYSYCTLPLVSGQTYTVSLYAKKAEAGNPQEILINTGGGEYTKYTLTDEWERKDFSFSSTDSISFKPTQEDGPAILIDAIQIEIKTINSPGPFTTN